MHRSAGAGASAQCVSYAVSRIMFQRARACRQMDLALHPVVPASQAILASTPSIRRSLTDHGLSRALGTAWISSNFKSRRFASGDEGSSGPVRLYVGRVAIEESRRSSRPRIQAPRKVVVGDRPARYLAPERWREAKFTRRIVRRQICSGGRVQMLKQDRHVQAGDDRGAGLQRCQVASYPVHQGDRRCSRAKSDDGRRSRPERSGR